MLMLIDFVTLMESIPLWHLASLFILGVLAFVISTISGGGGALILIPATSALIGAPAAPPVINLGTFISRPSRMIMFWHDIDWGLSTLFQYKFGKIDKTFNMPKAGFIPLGFIVAFISTIVGGLGPVLNPFYMNAGLQKEDLIATKTANSFFVGIAQISSYAFFGVLTAKLWIYGLVLGLGAVLGNYIGKRFLAGMSVQQFRLLLLILMTVSGLYMIYENIGVLF